MELKDTDNASVTWGLTFGHRAIQMSERTVAAGVALAFVLGLLAHALILPPYEGFDESAHYSYLSYLSDRCRIPDLKDTPLDAMVERDLAGLPQRYRGGTPEAAGYLTYRSFFQDLSSEERNEAVEDYWHQKRSVRYWPGEELNWQGQHPPLYYLSMVSVYRFMDEATAAGRILLLRLMSILIACGSLLFWYATVRLFRPGSTRWLLVVSGLIVLFFPSLCFDLARIGNDSLVALLFSGVFYFLMASYVHRQARLSDFWGVAVLLAMGLWTKLFFLPVIIGVAAGTAWLALVKNKLSVRQTVYRLALVVVVPLVLAVPWFVLYYQRYGVLLGGAESVQLQAALVPFAERASFGELLTRSVRAIAAFMATFLWSGTWSWIKRPLWHYVYVVPFAVLLLRGITLAVRGRLTKQNREVLVLALVALIPIAVALVYHLLIRVRLLDSGTAGYYLFSAWPVLGLMLALALFKLDCRGARMLAGTALATLLFFDISGWWFEMQVYSGLVYEVGKAQTLVGVVPLTFSNLSLVWDRLQVLAYPAPALTAYLLAVFLKLLLLFAVVYAGPGSERCDETLA
ncbi:MAG: hypothetical protein OEW00_02255 [candidate division Zixibacteria bacterium]|nr:hypothetical protein [candidate division Zixibacteria bacterium]